MISTTTTTHLFASLLAGALALAPAEAATAPSPPAVALVGATVVDGTGARPLPGAVVVIEGGRIRCVGAKEACPIPDGAAVIDAAGKWVTPGLIDAHVHFSQTGWADGRPDSLDVRDLYPYPAVEERLETHPERFFKAHLCSGTTTVFDVGGYPWTFDLPRRADAADAADATGATGGAPRVRVAGPLLSTWDFWLNLPAERQFLYLADPDGVRDQVTYLKQRGANAVKVWYIPDEGRPAAEMAAVVEKAGEEAKRAGLPLIVHATSLDLAKTALRAGAKVLVHSVGDRPVDAEFLRLAKENGTIYCPTLTVARGYLRMDRAALDGEAPEVDDPHGCVDRETLALVARTAEMGDRVRADGLSPGRLALRERALAQRERTEARNLVAVHEAGIPVAMGTDAGNPLTLHGPSVYAELEAMEAAGLRPMDVLVAATRGGAAAVGLSAEIGTVEAGKGADLLILSQDPTKSASAFRSVQKVIRAGTVYDVKDLASSSSR